MIENINIYIKTEICMSINIGTCTKLSFILVKMIILHNYIKQSFV